MKQALSRLIHAISHLLGALVKYAVDKLASRSQKPSPNPGNTRNDSSAGEKEDLRNA